MITFMATLESAPDQNYFQAALIGLAGAVVGAVVSTRLMQRLTASDVKTINLDHLATDKSGLLEDHSNDPAWLRGLNSILDGGKSGVEMGMAIIPGVLIISTIVMVLTFGPSADGYTGSAFEGVALLPKLAGELSWLFQFLFGFDHPELVGFPLSPLWVLWVLRCLWCLTLFPKALSVKATLRCLPPWVCAGVVI